MSYTRTLKDGSVKRYYTTSERAKQDARKRNRRDYWLDERYIRRELSTKRIDAQVTYVRRWYTWADLSRWYADALRNAYYIRCSIKADLRYKLTHQFTDDMSVGGLEDARLRLNSVLATVKWIEAIMTAYYRIYGES